MEEEEEEEDDAEVCVGPNVRLICFASSFCTSVARRFAWEEEEEGVEPFMLFCCPAALRPEREADAGRLRERSRRWGGAEMSGGGRSEASRSR